VSSVGVDGDGLALVKTATTAAGRDRLRREAELLTAIAHPGVVELRSFTEEAGRAELRQRWAGSRCLAGTRPGRVEEAAGVVAALAHTVADLHDAGLAHTRIDATHVVVAPDGRPVLCGLGDASTDPADRAQDVWALGRLLNELVGTDGELEPIPDRRLKRRDKRWHGYRLRAMLMLADQATAEPDHRPSARQLARSLATTIPDARLIADADEGARTPPVGAVLTHLDTEAPASAPPDDTTSAGPASAPTDNATSLERVEPQGRSDVVASATAEGVLSDDDARWEALWGVVERGAGPLHAVVDHELPSQHDERPPEHVEPPRPPNTRRRLLIRGGAGVHAAAALAGAALIAFGLMGLRAATAAPPSQRLTRSTRPTSVRTAATPSRSRPAHVATGRCPTVRAPAVDLDHDGCGEAVLVSGRRVTAGDAQFEVGRPGDQLVLGSWNCTGQVTPALLRPTTGEVFVFSSWAGDHPVVVPATAQVDGADGLRVEHHGNCDTLYATRPRNQPVAVPTP
jgi:hypothetical protein